MAQHAHRDGEPEGRRDHRCLDGSTRRREGGRGPSVQGTPDRSARPGGRARAGEVVRWSRAAGSPTAGWPAWGLAPPRQAPGGSSGALYVVVRPLQRELSRPRDGSHAGNRGTSAVGPPGQEERSPGPRAHQGLRTRKPDVLDVTSLTVTEGRTPVTPPIRIVVPAATPGRSHQRRCQTLPGYPEDGDAVTSVATPGLDNAPTTHARLLAWVREMAELTTPDEVVWVDGTDEEWERLTGKLVEAGTFTPPGRQAQLVPGASDPATSPGSRTAPSSARWTRPTPGRPTTGWTRPR